ncbi:sugar ABC transporter ATP-binding protein (plasmid) [Phyllobacterium sp. 628]|uniref:sugar ABC transporter ATP-binding protein n=1 Tax=Phyllobacterium sp. 628 TaxID=2718938 RepID=UPI001662271F|nr:sugar ABC transporter ATP-binding protein [Phyllobacterium sp. 628]QND54737.1 sugar ABC transporter ATP-binding protein [Phyllobacterium sp. 628]
MQPLQKSYLALSDISKSFVGIPVLRNVNFDVRSGEVHALLGENGAGKSTLIKIMSGLFTPDSGIISVETKETRFTSTADAMRRGITTVYQELLLFPELSVAENILLGHSPRHAWGGIDWRGVHARARDLLDQLDSTDLDVSIKVRELSVAQRQRVEIAKALSYNARVLIMDEPTASLAQGDVRRLMSIVKNLRSRGVGIIYVSHRMPEIFALADRVTVLRDGQIIGTEPAHAVNEARLVTMMVGRPIETVFPKSEPIFGETTLEVHNLSSGSLVKDVSFSLRRGEILGVAGLVGSGRTELAHALFGLAPATAGTIDLKGTRVTIRTPSQARDLGIAYVPEDRGLQGLIKSMSVRENLSMAAFERNSKGIFIRFSYEKKRARNLIRRFNIKAKAGPNQPVGRLSGGNQQKVVLAKWLETNPEVLILDEPTRGIDVGAKAEIHRMIDELAKKGMSIILISSELPEVLGMSDRVLIMNNGRCTAIIDRENATPERIGAAMTVSQKAEAA